MVPAPGPILAAGPPHPCCGGRFAKSRALGSDTDPTDPRPSLHVRQDMNTDLGLEIIRGDRPLSDVSRLGVTMSRTPLFFELDAPRRSEALVPSIGDVATGFLAHMSDGELLREWAAVILGAQFIDLIAL